MAYKSPRSRLGGPSSDRDDPRDLEAREQQIERQKRQFLTRFEQSREVFLSAIERTAGKTPGIPPKVFETIADIHHELHPKLADDLEKTLNESPKESLNRDLNAVKSKYATMLRDRVVAAEPEHGLDALNAISKETRPKGIFSGLADYIYNDNGIQFGGLIGGAVMAFAGFKLTAGSGMLTNVLGTLALGLTGAYLAHKQFDAKPEVAPTPDFHSKYNEPSTARGRERERNSPEDLSAALERGTTAPLEPADARTRNVRVARPATGPGLGSPR